MHGNKFNMCTYTILFYVCMYLMYSAGIYIVSLIMLNQQINNTSIEDVAINQGWIKNQL